MALALDEKQEIISAVLSSIRTNSLTIEQLTPVTRSSSDDWVELNGGRRISIKTIKNEILAVIGTLKPTYNPAIVLSGTAINTNTVHQDLCLSTAAGQDGLGVYWHEDSGTFVSGVEGTSDYYTCWQGYDEYGTVTGGKVLPAEGQLYEIDGVRYIGSGGTLVEADGDGYDIQVLSESEIRSIAESVFNNE